MTLMRVDPWNMLAQLQNEMNKLFESRLGLEEGDGRVVTADWIPAVDIKEEDDRYLIHADVPGVDPKDIEVTMENGILTIRGKREMESEEERAGYKRVERARGVFYRRFSLPDTADAERIAATCKNGVLEVVIPKKEQVQPRRITVQA